MPELYSPYAYYIGAGVVITTPSTLGNNGDALLSDGVGGTSWGSAGASPSGNNNEVLTDDGAGGIVSESNLTFDGSILVATSSDFRFATAGKAVLGASGNAANIGVAGGSTFSDTTGAFFEVSGNSHATRAGCIEIYAGNVASGEFRVYSNGTRRLTVPYGGGLGVGSGSTAPGAMLDVVCDAATDIGLIIEGAAAQSANLFEAHDSGGNTLLYIAPDGNMVHESTTSDDAKFQIITPTTNRDAYIQLEAGDPKATSWCVGLDNSDSDKFKLGVRTDGNSAGPEDNTAITVDTSGNVGISCTPNEKLQVDDAIAVSNDAEGSTARLTLRSARESVTLTGASTDTTINIPSGAKLIGASFNVDTAVVDDAGDDTWSAAYTGGSATSLASGAAAALNTKVDTLHVDEIASAQTNIRFTPNGGNFSAGVIEVVAYYYELSSLANA